MIENETVLQSVDCIWASGMAVFPYTNTNIQLQGMEVKEIYSITSEKNKETKNEFSLIH